MESSSRFWIQPDRILFWSFKSLVSLSLKGDLSTFYYREGDEVHERQILCCVKSGLLLNVLRHSFPFINGIDIILPSVSNSSGLVNVGSVLALKGFLEDKMLSTYERSRQGLPNIHYPSCSVVVGCVSLKTRRLLCSLDWWWWWWWWWPQMMMILLLKIILLSCESESKELECRQPQTRRLKF